MNKLIRKLIEISCVTQDEITVLLIKESRIYILS